MNNYSTIGRLTKEAETKLLQSGKSVTSFDLAVDVGFGDRKKTIFWPCKLWGERGETFGKYVKKGHQVGIVAEVDQEEWDDKTTGDKRKKLVLNVRDFSLLANGKQEETTSSPPPQQKYQGPEKQYPEDTDDGIIPF